MTTNLSTASNPVPGVGVVTDGAGLPAGLPDAALLERLANELFAALPGGGSSLASGAPPAGGSSTVFTGEYPLRAAATGALGQTSISPFAPEALLAAPTPQVGPTAVPPTVTPDVYGFDPRLSSLGPSAISALGPLSIPGRASVPGSNPLSTPPATPGVEVGSLPAASLVSPAAGYDLPNESDLHFLAGVSSPYAPPDAAAEHRVPTLGTIPASYYFLPGSQFRRPGSAEVLNLAPRAADLDPLPELAYLPSPGSIVSVPPSAASNVPAGDTGGSPVKASGEVGTGSFYFLDESRAFTALPGSGEPKRGLDAGGASLHPGFDVNIVRRDFPILQETVHGKPLIWFDNAATTQKPQAVIDRLAYFYSHENSNIHRAAHELAARSTDAYEAARDKVARFLHASSSDEIVFARGTTELINLIAQSWGRRHIEPGDEIVITWLEHHANIVPWQLLCKEVGAKLRVAPVDDSGQVLLDEYEKLFNSRTKLASFTQVSNALGTITPVKDMIDIAHRHGARVLVDGAQAVSHMAVDVLALDCDWYVFSGHKVFGPTGIGALYGKRDLLNATPPWQGGGNMIQDVTFEKTIYQPAPSRFEAGTGNIADAVGLGAALDYVERIGMENIARYEHELLVYATRGLSTIPGLRLIGTAAEKAGVLSFVLDGFRSEDVGEALNREGIAVRAGHHCAQPILRRYGLESTVRPSLAFYNTCQEVDALIAALWRIQSGSVDLPH